MSIEAIFAGRLTTKTTRRFLAWLRSADRNLLELLQLLELLELLLRPKTFAADRYFDTPRSALPGV